VLGIIGALTGGGGDGGSQNATDVQPTETTTATDQTTDTTTRTGAAASTKATTKTTEPAPEVAGIGDAVRDGRLEFVVSKVSCGKSRIGTTDFWKDAEGQYCTVNVKVANIGKEAQMLDARSQYLYGTGGQRFDPFTEAVLYPGLGKTRTLLERINPGSSVNGVLVYDIPKNEKPTKIEFHDSLSSRGVTVEM
jgi:hypothetical protein